MKSVCYLFLMPSVNQISSCLFLIIIIVGDADEYSLPYGDRVPYDPSIEDMCQVVAEEKVRPQIPKRLSGDQVGEFSVMQLTVTTSLQVLCIVSHTPLDAMYIRVHLIN